MVTEQPLLAEPVISNDTDDNHRLCGIVMPIAAMGDYPESHWLDVQNIIKEAVASTGYEARLVSESADATVIIKSIVQNVYKDEIVICDVSGMNPNVMFELGMRLAFDKPVVIIKDEVTRFSFDISTIEHLVYPRSLRYQNIQQFKKKLAEKIKATAQASKQENYSSFLTNFGSFTVANLKETTLNESEALERILSKLDKFDSRLLSLENTQDNDSGFLEYLNKTSSSKYRTVLTKPVGSLFTHSKFERLVADLDDIYGQTLYITVSGTGNSPDLILKVLAAFDPSPSELKRINNMIDLVLKTED